MISEVSVDFFDNLKEIARPFFRTGHGHGFDHVDRVYNMALRISECEDVDRDIIRASCLLHDIARNLEHESGRCHAEVGSNMARNILDETIFPKDKIEAVVHAISVHRYSKHLKAKTREAEILQDADRLDALGAIIIPRVFEMCGKDGLLIYDPNSTPAEVYTGISTSGITHLKEKSLRIKPETFNTMKAQKIAEGRYNYIKGFITQFEKEWRGEL